MTYGLFQQGKTPELIARERGLTLGTIYNHLARYIHTGDISLDNLIPEDHQQVILRAIHMAGADVSSTTIKNLCPPDITYNEIQLVLEAMK